MSTPPFADAVSPGTDRAARERSTSSERATERNPAAAKRSDVTSVAARSGGESEVIAAADSAAHTLPVA
eukprot:CAMPEP_0180249934 /NCGR_PEP_ID=MMETSP0987-20121128/37592_1 /TAXON_ID=697907 /ORGANISM="non described non described, Strain CCMP2293" /LENGTH=68 /DNA_ID=CAMNT_0022218289 /DNA_START=42 /DNA_END=244 /DNA_ORIENTATION=-